MPQDPNKMRGRITDKVGLVCIAQGKEMKVY